MAVADTVVLQEGTATISQNNANGYLHTPNESIDGSYSVHTGLAIHPDVNFTQSAVWETETNVNCNTLTITMNFDHWNPKHFLGSFRLYVTNDDRSTFADGNSNNGDGKRLN